MSEVETHRGLLIPVDVSGDTLEDRASEVCKSHGWEMPEWADSWIETLEEEGYKQYHIEGDTIYKLDDETLDSYGFVFGEKNDDGSIGYFISWYNGGGSISEVLSDAIKKANEDA